MRSIADRRAEKSGATRPASRAEMSGGRALFSAMASRSTGNVSRPVNETTWPVAWTPASVRPATVTLMGRSNNRESAVSSTPATVRSSG